MAKWKTFSPDLMCEHDCVVCGETNKYIPYIQELKGITSTKLVSVPWNGTIVCQYCGAVGVHVDEVSLYE